MKRKLFSVVTLILILFSSLAATLPEVQAAPLMSYTYANSVYCYGGSAQGASCSTTMAQAIDTDESTLGYFERLSGHSCCSTVDLVLPTAYNNPTIELKASNHCCQVLHVFAYVNGAWQALSNANGSVQSYNLTGSVTKVQFEVGDGTQGIEARVWFVRVVEADTPTATATATATATFTATNTASSTFTATSTGTITQTFTPSPTNANIPTDPNLLNRLRDGGMEDLPNRYWSLIDQDTTFGRRNDGSLWWFEEPLAACGLGYQFIGVENNSFLGLGGDTTFGGIKQQFSWPGGEMVVSLWHRASYSPIGPPAKLRVTVRTANGIEYYFGSEPSLDYVTSEATVWTQTIAGPRTLAAGNYTLLIDDYGDHDGFNHKFWIDEVIVIDEADQSDLIIPGDCSNGSEAPLLTPTPLPYNINVNCDFESGTAGWQLGSASTISTTEPNGPVGTKYLISTSSVDAAAVYSDEFYWGGGYLYLTAYIRSSGVGVSTIGLVNSSGFYQNVLSVTPNVFWKKYNGYTNVPAGSYHIVLPAGVPNGTMYDGVQLSSGAYQDCIQSATLTPTVSRTPSRTPTGTLPTPTITLTATRTAIATGTPTLWYSATPRTPTYPTQPPFTATSPATSTLPPTATNSDAQKTATAQGTSVSTYTPYPTYTPQNTYTPYPGTGGGGSGVVLPPDPPNQPPPAYDAECVPPLMGGVDVAGWAAYQQCRALNYVSWSPTNTNQLAVLPTLAANREPFSTINQTTNTLDQFSLLLNSVDWDSTGGGCNTSPDPLVFLHAAQGLVLGQLTFTDSTYSFDSDCSMAAEDIVGPFITQGICIIINILCLTGFLPIIQWIVNIFLAIAFVLYLKAAWIDKLVV